MSYDVFMSYSHAADGKLAPALQSGLQQFARPWNSLRALHVFRDKTGLSANPGLWSAIQSALESSRNFVLLASPGAANSHWVQKEVTHWLDRADASKLLLVLTDGTIEWSPDFNDFKWEVTTALPPNVRGKFSEEPLWIDLRWASNQDHLSLQNPRFRDAVADLSSALRQVPKDQLIGEDVRQHRKAVIFRRSAISGLIGLIVALAVVALLAVKERNAANVNESLARKNQQTAESNAELARYNEQQATQNALNAKRNEDLAKRQEASALRRLYVSQMNLAYHAWIENNPALAYDLLNAQLPSPGREDLRSFDWYYLWHVSHNYLANIPGADPLLAVAWSPDGRRIATSSSRSDVRIYDTRGRIQQEFAHAAGGPFNQLAFTLAGQLVGCTRTGLVSVWDFDANTIVRNRQIPNVAWSDNALSADGSVAAYWTKTDQVVLISTLDDALPLLFEPKQNNVSALALSSNGKQLAVVSGDGALWISKPDSPGQLSQLAKESGGLVAVAFAPAGDFLATGSMGGTIKLWDLSGHNPSRTAAVDRDVRISSLAFFPDGHSIAAGTQDSSGFNQSRPGSIVVWRPNHEPSIYRGHLGSVNAVAVAPGGLAVASASADKSLKIWDASVDQDFVAFPLGRKRIFAVALSHDGSRLVTGSEGLSSGGPGDVVLWDLRSHKQECTLAGHTSDVNAVAFYSTNLVISGSADGTIRLWDSSCGGLRGQLETNPKFRVRSITADPARHQLIAAGGDHLSGSVQIWDVPSLRTKSILRIPQGSYLTAATSANGDWLALGAYNENPADQHPFLLYHLHHLLAPGTPPGFAASVTTPQFSPSGDLLAVGWNDRNKPGNISLWDLDPLHYRGDLVGNYMGIFSLAFTPDGKSILSASGIGITHNVGELKVWDLATMQERATILHQTSSLGNLSLSADGRTLAVLDSNNILRIFRAASEREVLADTDSVHKGSPFDLGSALNFARACWAVSEMANGSKLTCLERARRALSDLQAKGIQDAELRQWFDIFDHRVHSQ